MKVRKDDRVQWQHICTVKKSLKNSAVDNGGVELNALGIRKLQLLRCSILRHRYPNRKSTDSEYSFFYININSSKVCRSAKPILMIFPGGKIHVRPESLTYIPLQFTVYPVMVKGIMSRD